MLRREELCNLMVGDLHQRRVTSYLRVHGKGGRGGHFTTAVQDHPSPDFAARSSVTRADMTISESAKKEMAQDPLGRCVRTRVKSAEAASDACYWAVNDLDEEW